MGGVSITIDQGVGRDRGRAAYARDSVGAQGAIGDAGQRWYRLLAENEQGKVRASEEVEEPDLLTARGIDTRRIGGAVTGADARPVIEVTSQWATPVGDAQLGNDRSIRNHWYWPLLGTGPLVQ